VLVLLVFFFSVIVVIFLFLFLLLFREKPETDAHIVSTQSFPSSFTYNRGIHHTKASQTQLLLRLLTLVPLMPLRGQSRGRGRGGRGRVSMPGAATGGTPTVAVAAVED
jgi:hypothetical protein